jgi:acyl carrier protein
VARAWRDITGIANVTDLVLDNSLSALGFNSLQAIALIGRLESELRIEIPPRVLVEARSGAELIAAVTDRLHASAAGPAPRSPTSPSSVTAPLTKGVGAERVRGAAWRES